MCNKKIEQNIEHKVEFLDKKVIDRGRGWDLQNPFTIEITVCRSDIDSLGHANNVAYVKWLEEVSWAHSASLGIDLVKYNQLQRAMVIRRHVLEYLAPSFLGNKILIGTWIVMCDEKYSLTRRFQICKTDTGQTIFRGATTFVCVDLKSGRPRRMPEAYSQVYGAAVSKE